jgi:uncharacterized membrane protein YkoI
MTKYRLILTTSLLLAGFFGVIYFFKGSELAETKKSITPAKTSIVATAKTDTSAKVRISNDGKTITRAPSQEDDDQNENSLQPVNHVTQEWEPNLEKAIREQGGSAIKEVKIKKVDSIIWEQDGMALHAESVVISVKNDKDEETSFRALVDAQTGKILKNWDQPIIDPVNPRDNFKVRIDPRYHQE